MNKTIVCLIFGGKSFEHDVSITSANNVAKSLDKDKYEIHLIGITKKGRWLYVGNEISKIKTTWLEDSEDCLVSHSTCDSDIVVLSKNHYTRIKVDVFLPILHGQNGEDGTVQGLLELSGVPYIGSGVVGSAICMDKSVAKIQVANVGIPQADWVVLRAEQKTDCDLLEQKIGYPCFIKPANSGSSIGISKVENREELLVALKIAYEHDRKVVAEKSIENAIEIECSVIGNESPIVSTKFGQIVPSNRFYDYDAKYVSNSKVIIPAKLSEAVVEKIHNYAVLAYKACECLGMARIDFFVDDDQVYLNEINTIPGFTDISMFPKLFEEDGISTSKLLDMLIDFALRHKKGMIR